MKLQFQLLFTAALNNFGRDEDGRPKTTVFGGVQRGRMSSQARKRAIRFADHFVAGNRAIRTRELGILAFDRMTEFGVGSEAQRALVSMAVNYAVGAGDEGCADMDGLKIKKRPTIKDAETLVSGTVKGDDKKSIKKGKQTSGAEDQSEAEKAAPESEAERMQRIRKNLRSKQGLVVSTRERAGVDRMVEVLREAWSADRQNFDAALEKAVRSVLDDKLLTVEDIDDDLALFGRMVAVEPEYDVEAAVSVSHAITTHEMTVEADYYSAGEELQQLGEKGAAITGYQFFGSGIYYQHITLDWGHLASLLGHEGALRAVRKLLKGVLYALPRGKVNAFAHMTPIDYVLVAIGDAPTCNLSGAFLTPIEFGRREERGNLMDPMAESIFRLRAMFEAVNEAHKFDLKTAAFQQRPIPGSEGGKTPMVATVDALEAFIVDSLTIKTAA